MNDPVLGMDLVLPADAEPLAERTAALGEWCQGYLLDWRPAVSRRTRQLPEDAAELIRDFTDISAAGFEVDASDEEDEVALPMCGICARSACC